MTSEAVVCAICREDFPDSVSHNPFGCGCKIHICAECEQSCRKSYPQCPWCRMPLFVWSTFLWNVGVLLLYSLLIASSVNGMIQCYLRDEMMGFLFRGVYIQRFGSSVVSKMRTYWLPLLRTLYNHHRNVRRGAVEHVE